MAFRFRKSIKLAPGIRVNLSKSGIGVSAGIKGARIGVNSRGTYSSVGIPGTGISMLSYHGKGKSGASRPGNVPQNYVLTSEFGEINVIHSARGIPRYAIEISHPGLNKFQIVKGDSQEDVEQKACAKMVQWNEMWERSQAAECNREAKKSKANAIAEKKALADEQTIEAQRSLDTLDSILAYTLGIDDTIDWNSLKGPEKYPEESPTRPSPLQKPVQPEIPPKPSRSDAKYRIEPTILGKLFKSIDTKKKSEAEKVYMSDHEKWEINARAVYSEYESRLQEYERNSRDLENNFLLELKGWEDRRSSYAERWKVRSEYVNAKQYKYNQQIPEVVHDYCELVLNNSVYPDSFPQAFETCFDADCKLLVVDYQIPAPEDLPVLKEVKYVQTRDEFVQKEISQAQCNKNFSKVAFQIAVRTLHELFEADKSNALRSIVFNGYVATVDPGTGEDAEICVLSIEAEKQQFLAINLDKVDSGACFSSLGGKCGSPLHKLRSIEPSRSSATE